MPGAFYCLHALMIVRPGFGDSFRTPHVTRLLAVGRGGGGSSKVSAPVHLLCTVSMEKYFLRKYVFMYLRSVCIHKISTHSCVCMYIVCVYIETIVFFF